MTVKREFIIERQGRSFVLYAGLLDLAHAQGLKAIRTRVIQIPSEDNGQTAIVSAEAETERGTFSGIGDANPSNVSRAMLNCTIRLAETRAKARALRDAVNVGATAFEELSEDEPAVEHPPAPPTHAPTGTASPRPAESAAVARPPQIAQNPNVATPAQVRAIYSIGRDQHDLSETEVEERARVLFGTEMAQLTRKQASEFITSLKGGDSRPETRGGRYEPF